MNDPAGEGMEWGAVQEVFRSHGVKPTDKLVGVMLTFGYADRGLIVTELSPGVKAVYTSDAYKGNDDVRDSQRPS